MFIKLYGRRIKKIQKIYKFSLYAYIFVRFLYVSCKFTYSFCRAKYFNLRNTIRLISPLMVRFALIPIRLSLIRASHVKEHFDFRLYENSPDLYKAIFYISSNPESDWTDYTLEWLRQLRDNHAMLTVHAWDT